MALTSYFNRRCVLTFERKGIPDLWLELALRAQPAQRSFRT
jgi:hypothetical protein